MNRHDPSDTMVYCPECVTKFPQSAIAVHYAQCVEGARKRGRPCKSCGESVSGGRELFEEHLKSHEQSKETFYCDQCEEQFREAIQQSFFSPFSTFLTEMPPIIRGSYQRGICYSVGSTRQMPAFICTRRDKEVAGRQEAQEEREAGQIRRMGTPARSSALVRTVRA